MGLLLTMAKKKGIFVLITKWLRYKLFFKEFLNQMKILGRESFKIDN